MQLSPEYVRQLPPKVTGVLRLICNFQDTHFEQSTAGLGPRYLVALS